jgi:hypothetical protein
MILISFLGHFSPVGLAFLIACVAIKSRFLVRCFSFLLIIPLVFLILSRLEVISSQFSSIFSYTLGHTLLLWLGHMALLLFKSKTSNQKAWKLIFDARGITASKISPDILRKLKRESPCRARFILGRIFLILACGGMYFGLLTAMKNQHLYARPLSANDFSVIKRGVLRRMSTGSVSLREILIRLLTILNFLLPNYIALNTLHSILAIVFVGLGIDQPHEWPPLFGRFVDITSLGSFWGTFWHSLAYKTYTSFAKIIALNLLQLTPGKYTTTATIRCQVFLYSGLLHALVSWLLGVRCGLSQEVLWFCGNFFAMILEVFISEILGPHSSISKTAGRIWVIGFFFWSLPKVHYPKFICQ